MRHTALSIAVLGLFATSCGILPDDHALNRNLARSTQRLVDSARTIVGSVDSGARRLTSLTTKVQEIPDATARGLLRLRGAGEQFVDNAGHRLQRTVPRIRDDLDAMTDASLQRLRSLTGTPARVGEGVGHSLGDLKHMIGSIPSTLRLDRTPMPTADDPERTVELYPTSRRRSWLERALDRMSF